MIKLAQILQEIRLIEDDDFDLSDNPLDLDTKEKAEGEKYRTERSFEQQNPIKSLKTGKKSVRGYGEIFNIDNPPSAEDVIQKDLDFISRDDIYYTTKGLKDDLSSIRNANQNFNIIAKFFGITWERFGIFKEPHFNVYSRHPSDSDVEYYLSKRLNYYFVLEGTDEKGTKYIFNERFNTLLTPEGKAVISQPHILGSSKYDLYNQKIIAKLFPSSQQGDKSKEKPKSIRKVLDDPNLDTVQLNFGTRIKRGGPGIRGKYNDLKDYLSIASQQNLVNTMEENGITWDDMIIYREYGDTLFAVLGKDKEGREYMFDRAGHGQGSYSKLRGPLEPKK